MVVQLSWISFIEITRRVKLSREYFLLEVFSEEGRQAGKQAGQLILLRSVSWCVIWICLLSVVLTVEKQHRHKKRKIRGTFSYVQKNGRIDPYPYSNRGTRSLSPWHCPPCPAALLLDSIWPLLQGSSVLVFWLPPHMQWPLVWSTGGSAQSNRAASRWWAR